MTKAWSHEGTCRAYESREGASAVWRKGLGEGSSLSCRLHQQGMLEGGMDGVCIDLFHTTKIRLLPHVRSSLAWWCFSCARDVEHSAIFFPKDTKRGKLLFHAWKADSPKVEPFLSKGGAFAPLYCFALPACGGAALSWSGEGGGIGLLSARCWTFARLSASVSGCGRGVEDAYVGDFYYLCSKEMIKRGGERASSLCIHPYHLRDAL